MGSIASYIRKPFRGRKIGENTSVKGRICILYVQKRVQNWLEIADF